MSINGESGRHPLPSPDIHLFTWVDVDRVFVDLESDGAWPGWLCEIDAYWHGVRIVVTEGTTDDEVWNFLKQVLGPLTVDCDNQLILLDAVSAEARDRSLVVDIEHSLGCSDSDPRPQWAPGRVIAKLSAPLDPKAAKAIPDGVSICAFHSFKGGVGRTLHCVATATAIAGRGSRVLLVDADLEAPGITWMWQAQSLRADFAFEDFLALVHGSKDDEFVEAIELGAKFLANQEVDGVVVMPARRDYSRLEPTRIEPVDLLTSDRDPFLLTGALAALARRLGVDVVLVDLRAGISELNAPLLLDSRVHRVMVSTISDQSVRGTLRVLEELGRRAPARAGSDDPSVTVLLTQFSARNHQDRLEEVAAQLSSAVSGVVDSDSSGSEADSAAVIMTSQFDVQPLNPGASWVEVRAAVTATRLEQAMAQLMQMLLPAGPTRNAGRSHLRSDALDTMRRDLARFAQDMVFAEKSDSEDFLPTAALENLAESHRTEVPVEVIIGAKGSVRPSPFFNCVPGSGGLTSSRISGLVAPRQMPVLFQSLVRRI